MPHDVSIKLQEEWLTELLKKEAYNLGDIWFGENQSLKGMEGQIEKLIVFGWNRAYPFDFKLDLDLEQMEKTAEEEFAGYSHEKITRLQYRKKERA